MCNDKGRGRQYNWTRDLHLRPPLAVDRIRLRRPVAATSAAQSQSHVISYTAQPQFRHRPRPTSQGQLQHCGLHWLHGGTIPVPNLAYSASARAMCQCKRYRPRPSPTQVCSGNNTMCGCPALARRGRHRPRMMHGHGTLTRTSTSNDHEQRSSRVTSPVEEPGLSRTTTSLRRFFLHARRSSKTCIHSSHQEKTGAWFCL